jgi:hypothetical protein
MNEAFPNTTENIEKNGSYKGNFGIRSCGFVLCEDPGAIVGKGIPLMSVFMDSDLSLS